MSIREVKKFYSQREAMAHIKKMEDAGREKAGDLYVFRDFMSGTYAIWRID
tara:strand:- start:1868 stop:2020 length:153 start_codon:yes stop_codon:yes gene_type:complete